ncbi:nucleoside-diphosphate-sugar epimerase [Paraburkholderia sp. MM5496-R1]
MSLQILVTGANGFVGQAVSRALLRRGDRVTGVVRRPQTAAEGVREWLLDTEDFAGIDQRWPVALTCDAVIHLASRVHVMRETLTERARRLSRDQCRGQLARRGRGAARGREALRVRQQHQGDGRGEQRPADR